MGTDRITLGGRKRQNWGAEMERGNTGVQATVDRVGRAQNNLSPRKTWVQWSQKEGEGRMW